MFFNNMSVNTNSGVERSWAAGSYQMDRSLAVCLLFSDQAPTNIFIKSCNYRHFIHVFCFRKKIQKMDIMRRKCRKKG